MTADTLILAVAMFAFVVSVAWYAVFGDPPNYTRYGRQDEEQDETK